MNKIGNFENLVADLIADSEHGSKLYNYIYRQGRLVDIRRGDSWVSWSNTQHGVITLGVGEQPPEHLGWLAPQCKNQWQAMQHRLFHEMGHLATLTHIGGANYSEPSPLTRGFMEELQAIRREHSYQLGASAIGSIRFYGDLERYAEDAADIIALAARGDELTEKHMVDLARPAHINSRIGLATLNVDAVMALANRTNEALRRIGMIEK